MSTVPTPFQAKDGLYYSSYEEKRNANIRRNHEVLVQKGLEKPLLQSLKPRSTGALSPVKRKPPAAVVSPHSGPRRLSNRIRKAPPPLSDLTEDWRKEPSKKGKADHYEEIQYWRGETKLRRQQIAVESLTKEERLQLSRYVREESSDEPSWVADMDEYLRREESISDDNRKSVMKQVRKMVSRQGITYMHWTEGTYFGQAGISLSDDFIAMYDSALEFENEHGRDKGNGTFVPVVLLSERFGALFC
jgi:hypothetical protein